MISPSSSESILIVDDAPDTREVLRRNLELNSYKVFTAPGVSEAIDILEKIHIDLVITDYKMPGSSGLDLIRHVRENLTDTEVMMITGYATIRGAVQAVKTGAEEYLAKPFTDEELLSAVRRSLDKLGKHRTHSNLSELAAEAPYGLVGESKAMCEVYRAIEKAATTTATVLITGDSGTGKELVARAIHYSSERASGPLVPLNCGGIPEGLLESELFGHVKGSFTGATETRAGFFQTAEGGSIILDEIAELAFSLQVKLLRVLQDKEFSMVGTTRTCKVDVRIIAATNKDLQVLVRKGLFREDLFFRLNVIQIHVPPLRDRGEDVILLAHYYLRKCAKEFDKSVPRFSDKALRALSSYDWPGNVRELENLVQRVVVMSDTDVIDVSDLPSPMRFTVLRGTSLKKTLAEVEAEHIQNVLVSTGGNKTKASAILGINRKTLIEKSKRFSQKS